MFERISLKLGELLAGLNREEGQGATEYAIILGFLVIGITLMLGGLGTGIQTFLDNVGTRLSGLVVP